MYKQYNKTVVFTSSAWYTARNNSRIFRMTKSRLAVIAGIVVGVAAIAGAATFQYVRTNNPENLFYAALAEKMPDEQYSKENSVGDNDVRVTSSSYFSKDGSFVGEGKITCDGFSEAAGETDMTVTVRQVDEELFVRFDDITSSSMEDADLTANLAAHYAEISDKWINISSTEPRLAGYKEHGVFFDILGTTSKKFNEQQIADLLKEEKVITVRDSRSIKYQGRPSVEYDVQVSRAAYKKFMDRVHPGFQYKDEVVDLLFVEDYQDITITVDKERKIISQTSYSMPNLCGQFLMFVDEDAANEAPSRMHIVVTRGAKSDIKDLAVPSEFITLEELGAIIYGEEPTEE